MTLPKNASSTKITAFASSSESTFGGRASSKGDSSTAITSDLELDTRSQNIQDSKNGEITDTDSSSPEVEVEDESKYPGGFKLVALTLGLCLACWVVALDNTIIATAIPKITTQFPDALNDVGWYGSAYLLTNTSLQPSFGKVFTYFDVKWTYLSALVIFEVGSVICAAASSSEMLIVGRAVAGVGAAALFSGSMTIIGFSVPLRKRAIYIASVASMFGIASVVGPILGGAFTDRVSWRWCFWINLPFGALSIAAVFFFFENPKRQHADMTLRQKFKQIDALGALLLICAIVCLLLALQWGGTTYAWSDSKVWGCLLGFGLLISAFIALQIRLGEKATIPPRILVKQRTMLTISLFSLFLSMALYTHIYYLPFYFQAVKGTTAEGSGIRIIAYLVSQTLASIIVGGLITYLGPYVPFMWGAGLTYSIGCGLLYTLRVDSSPAHWIGYQILAGLGSGAGVQIPFIAVQVVLSEKDMPSGNAIAIFFNTLGGAVSISVAQNIFSNQLLAALRRDAPAVDPGVVVRAGATHFRDVVPEALVPDVLEAYNTAVTSAFILPIATSVVALLCSLFVERGKSVKGKKIAPGGGA